MHGGERPDRPTCGTQCGTPVAAAAGQGSRTDEGVTGVHAYVSCKVNYAANVKEIMPYGPRVVKKPNRLENTGRFSSSGPSVMPTLRVDLPVM
jgi:hypothetical protein